jgi:glycosyltransferase involved in cell wall biosynthesis
MTISKKDHIADIELEEKLASVSSVRPMKLCYIGRAIEMKGPIDWLDTISEMIKEGIKLHATWLGDGSLLPEMRSAAEAMDISAHVDLPGFVGDRHVIQKTLREADILLFCHKTKESARIFGEALASGCPIVGYGSAYPKELVEQHGGGVFVEVGDRRGLATAVRGLAQDPTALRELIRRASLSGRQFDRDSLMQRRIDLIKQHAVQRQH